MIRTSPLLLILAFSAAGCRHSGPPNDPDPPAETRRADRATALRDAGIDPNAVTRFLDDARAGAFGRFDHFILMRHGRLLVDERLDVGAPQGPREATADHQYDYEDPGWHPYYRAGDLHTQQSVTKSVTSILVGMAIDDGSIPDGVSTPAMSWFGDYDPDATDPRRAAMTLEDLLTMRSGIDWNESLPYSDPDNTCTQLELSDDWISFVVDRPMREAPGERFDYNSGASVLLGKIVREATGQPADEFAQARLFAPLGITEFYWKRTPKGEVDTEGGLYLRPLDMARIAQLMLQGGQWEGRQLVSKHWVERSTSPVVPRIDPEVATSPGYGYQWWIDGHRPDEPYLFAGNGYGGQFPIVLPELDVVMMLQAWNLEPPARSATEAVMTQIVPTIDASVPVASQGR